MAVNRAGTLLATASDKVRDILSIEEIKSKSDLIVLGYSFQNFRSKERHEIARIQTRNNTYANL